MVPRPLAQVPPPQSEQEKEIKKAEKSIAEAKARHSKSSKVAKAKDNALKEIELEVNSELGEGLKL